MSRRKAAAAALAAALLLALPAPARAAEWTLDPAHTIVSFRVRYMMISWVRGVFGKVKGEATYVPGQPATARVAIEIEVASIDTQHERRDDHLRSGDFLLAEKHPAIAFKSKGVRNARADGFDLVGDLTIRGTTKEVVLKVEDVSGVTKDPRGRERVGATATTRINRHDFGASYNRVLEAGGVLVGDDVHITLDVQFIKKAG
ncbi:MAG: YceI family protein [Nitrospinota bacterium]